MIRPSLLFVLLGHVMMTIALTKENLLKACPEFNMCEHLLRSRQDIFPLVRSTTVPCQLYKQYFSCMNYKMKRCARIPMPDIMMLGETVVLQCRSHCVPDHCHQKGLIDMVGNPTVFDPSKQNKVQPTNNRPASSKGTTAGFLVGDPLSSSRDTSKPSSKMPTETSGMSDNRTPGTSAVGPEENSSTELGTPLIAPTGIADKSSGKSAQISPREPAGASSGTAAGLSGASPSGPAGTASTKLETSIGGRTTASEDISKRLSETSLNGASKSSPERPPEGGFSGPAKNVEGNEFQTGLAEGKSDLMGKNFSTVDDAMPEPEMNNFTTVSGSEVMVTTLPNGSCTWIQHQLLFLVSTVCLALFSLS